MKNKLASIKFSSWLLFGLIVLVHIWLLSKLVFFPYPEIFVYPYLANHGLLPYAQIFDQHFPGLLFFPINFESLGMTTETTARMWQLSIVGLSQFSLFLLSKHLFNTKKALIIAILYLIWQPFLQGWMLWTNNVLVLIYLLAFYFSYQFIINNQKYRKLFLAGLFFGIATIFKQVVIPLAGLVFLYIFFLNRSIKVWWIFGLGFLLPVFLMLGWISYIGVLKDFWFWTVQFNLTTYVAMGGKPPTMGELIRLSFIYFPSVFVLLKRYKDSYQLPILLIIFIGGGMFGGGHRFDLTYFQPSLPFVCMASVLGGSIVYRKSQKMALFIFAGYFLIAGLFLSRFYQGHWKSYTYYFDSDTMNMATKIKQQTEVGEEIFIFGASPILYQMTETLPAGRLFVFQFPWFLKESQGVVYQALMESNPNIVVSDPTTRTDDQEISVFASDLYNYIYSNYHLIQKVGTVEILKKNK